MRNLQTNSASNNDKPENRRRLTSEQKQTIKENERRNQELAKQNKIKR